MMVRMDGNTTERKEVLKVSEKKKERVLKVSERERERSEEEIRVK